MGACLKGSEWVVSCINMPNSCLKLCRLPTIYSTRNCDVSSFSSSCGLQKLLVALLLALTSLYLSAQASLSRDPACKQAHLLSLLLCRLITTLAAPALAFLVALLLCMGCLADIPQSQALTNSSRQAALLADQVDALASPGEAAVQDLP
eukprot:1144866-Pelagomonas_calceolata.AAC.1